MANKGSFSPKDIAGQRYAMVVAVEDTGKKAKDGSHIWKMRCDCGKEFERSAGKFRKTLSCGCKMYDNSGQYQAVDHSGIELNDCLILEPTDKRGSAGYVIWKARCNLCGEIFERPADAIVHKRIRHRCAEYWRIYGPSIARGRKPIPNNGAHVNALYGHYRHSAAVRGISFELSKEEARILFEGDCAYCGQPPTYTYTSVNLAGSYNSNGIDRVDNEKDYTVENCVSCCTNCNWAKRTRDVDEFKDWISRAYHHLFPDS